MSRLLPDRSRSIGIALALGAVSSSCSYAAVALARSIFRKGADFTAAMAFEMASTNLVLELSIILIVFMGWPFMAAEALAAPIMVGVLALLFRAFLRPGLVREAREQADKGVAGRMEGHAEMDMSVPAEGPLWRRLASDRGFTAISHYFVMDWASVWMDIVGGLAIAGAIAAWTPRGFWNAFFLTGHPVLSKLWGPIVGPLVAIVAFVCREHPACRRAVERRHQLRRRALLHSRRPDRAAGPQHLSQVLRMEDGRLCSQRSTSRWRCRPSSSNSSSDWLA